MNAYVTNLVNERNNVQANHFLTTLLKSANLRLKKVRLYKNQRRYSLYYFIERINEVDILTV